MAEGAWRPGMATRCGSCGAQVLTYTEDGSAHCAACGSVTAPARAGPATPVSQEPPAVEARPPLRFVTSSAETTAPLHARRAPVVRLEPAAGPQSAPAWDLRRNRIVAGAVFIVIGVVVTAGTYSLATSSPAGGTYFIVFGPIIYGVYLLARGLTTPAGVPALVRRTQVRRSTAAPTVTGRVSSSAPTPRTSPGLARKTKWPLLVFVVGLVLLLVGEGISLMSVSWAETVGDAVGIPGIFLMILAPIWWVIARIRGGARRTPL